MKFVRALIVLALIVSIFANIIMYQKWSGKRPIFTVNGQGVSRRELLSYLEARSGPQVKAKVVQEMMVEQEAKKQNVWPTDQEVNEAFNEMREDNWQFAQRVESTPWMEAEQKKEIRQILAKSRLLTKGVPVSPDEIKAEYNARPARYDTPRKAVTEFAAVLDESRTNDIKELLQKGVAPAVIRTQLKGAVAFLGYNQKMTLKQPLGTKQNQEVFNMKPGQVKVVPPGQLARAGAKALVIKLVEIKPGKKADLNDAKLKEKLTVEVASRRMTPWQEYFSKMWADTKFESEDPNDKKIVEGIFFPDRMKTASR